MREEEVEVVVVLLHSTAPAACVPARGESVAVHDEAGGGEEKEGVTLDYTGKQPLWKEG